MTPLGRGSREGRGGPADTDVPTPLAEVLELLAGESATSRAFLGGVVLGALVGAALAGASLVRDRTTGHVGRTPGR